VAHHARVNAPHPIERAASAEEVAQRRAWADEARRAQEEKIRANEGRFQSEEAGRVAAGRRGLPRMQTGGSEGLEIKR
jgi:hypothetical protein